MPTPTWPALLAEARNLRITLPIGDGELNLTLQVAVTFSRSSSTHVQINSSSFCADKFRIVFLTVSQNQLGQVRFERHRTYTLTMGEAIAPESKTANMM